MNRLLPNGRALFWLVLSFSLPVCALGAEDFSGKTVTSVGYEPAAQPVDPRDLKAMQLVEAGQPLNPVQVAASIDRLYASGLYDDIEVDAQPSGTGVAIRFVTHPRKFIGHVGVEGQISDPPSRAVIISDSQLALGYPYDPETLATAQKTIAQEMKQNGLYESQVGVATVEDPLTHEMTIRFLVTAGKRARYEAPAINGDAKLPDKTIVKATGWRIPLIRKWRQVTSALTDAGTEGIQKKYAKAGRLTATVDMNSLDYDPDTGRAKATFDINAGPKVTIKAVEAKVSKSKMKAYIPVYEEGTIDRDLLTEGARNLHDYFQSKGYPDVDVTFKEEPVQNDQEVINYYIATGPRRRLVSVQIEGSDYFEQDTLRERMFLRPSSLLLRYGRYSESFRSKDADAIESLYQANGFRDVKVTSTVRTDYKGKPNDIAVTYHIDQGKQWKVASLKIEGANRLDLTSLVHNQLTSAENQPYADVSVSTDRNLILAYYYAHGFPNATFKYVMSPGDEPQTVNLLYQIHEGPQEFVRRVILSGLYRTKPSLVQNKIDLPDGEPMSMVKINDTARELSNLGIFSSVNTGLLDPNGSTLYKDVLFDFDEAARYTFSVGLGLEVGQFGGTTTYASAAGGSKGTSPIVSFDVSRLNFRGVGETISLDARYSTLEQRESINYIVPHFLGSVNRTVTFTLLYDTTEDVQTFSARREEARVQTSQRFNRASTLLASFIYRRDAPNTVVPALTTPAFTQAVRLGIVSLSYIQDHRDSPADAHHGFWNTLDTDVAGHFFGSQRNYFRFLARNATYTSIGHGMVFARQTQIGGIIPYGVGSGTNTFDYIPLPERFFGGGSVSMRGFGDNQAGPRDIGTASELPGSATSAPTGFPIGGNGLFFNTFELRFPLLYPNLTGVFFHDMGNIYTTFNDVSLAYRQPGTQVPYQNFNFGVQAPGFGIRYKTPVGPVRLDLAYALNPPTYQGFSTSETLQELLSCTQIAIRTAGNACSPTTQRLSKFEFFFSIGQAF